MTTENLGIRGKSLARQLALEKAVEARHDLGVRGKADDRIVTAAEKFYRFLTADIDKTATDATS